MSMRNTFDRRDSSLDDAAMMMEQQQQQQDTLSDDDNAQIELPEQEVVEVEDPLLMAMDDLEGRVVAALDDVKLHPGVRTSATSNVHEELATLLRPVLEVAAHTGPSIARTYYRGEEIESSVEDVYQRVVSDLVLPVMLEMAQSERSPAKLGASLEFFRHFWKECHKAGSWLDTTTTGIQAGPYGAGGSHSSSGSAPTPAMRAILKRRQVKRLAREGEILRYWVQASIACTEPGVLTSDEGEGAVASRGIIAASASLRPSLRHIAQRIRDTDDRGANRLYSPVMKMVEGVLKQLFLGNPNESVLSSSLKFLEIVVMCCSNKPKDAVSTRRRGQSTLEDFSLDDLPAGHPIITREALESIADYAFTTLRGLTLIGGQVKIDANILSDMLMAGGGFGSPSEQVVSILKPAALAYLEIESHLKNGDDDDVLDYTIDRAGMELDFELSQKSYSLSINAISALAIHRPVFFKEAAICLARRAVQPPIFVEGGILTKSATLALTSQLKSSCLTLLRNALSVATNAYDVLQRALKRYDMELQAEKALSMARQATALKTAGRAARNRANMYYEWDASDDRITRRQRETDDALAKMRAAKAARGLGHGIQLPTSMTDAVELVLTNLVHLPTKRPAGSSSAKAGKIPLTFDSVVDAIMTNGASLAHEEGQWYERDGSIAWETDIRAEEEMYKLSPTFEDTLKAASTPELEKEDERNAKRRKVFKDQCESAASDAVARIMAVSHNSRSKSLAKLGNNLISRLSFSLNGIKSGKVHGASYLMAKKSLERVSGKLEDENLKESIARFIESFPLVASALAADASPTAPELNNSTTKEIELSLGEYILNEALLQSCVTAMDDPTRENVWKYDCALALYVALTINAGELSNDKPSDLDKKKAAVNSMTKLQIAFSRLPRLTETSILLLAAICDIEDITKKALALQRKGTSQEAIALAAATHAAKVASEKRATAALLILRDVAFQRDQPSIRRVAVQCAVAIASCRLPSSPLVQEKALKLVMNVLYTKNETLGNFVAESVIEEMERASNEAVSMYDAIQKANKSESKEDDLHKNPLAPLSDEEKNVMERMRRPSVLCMALCVRRPELIQKLFELSSVEKADVLSKAVRANMSKLSKACAAKHGASNIALKIAEMTGPNEVPMLLSFLENLAPSNDRSLPEQDVIDACFKIQVLKQTEDGKKDPRFLIPVVSAMLRKDLVLHLAEFVAADDAVFLAALVRMGDRVGRQALLFRDEMDEENATLRGMTLCEQLVFLHHLDFAAASMPQKRYLNAIKLCLADEEVYNDRVVMAALDHMSGVFLSDNEKLPLAFMRTCIIVTSQHESLHSWICNELLPRLIEGKIYDDPRQWEGWMRCAHVLENSDDPSVSSIPAINKLPPEQLMQYQTKWSGK